MKTTSFVATLITTSWAQPQASHFDDTKEVSKAENKMTVTSLVDNYLLSSDLMEENQHSSYIYEMLKYYRKSCKDCVNFVRDPKLDFVAFYASRRHYHMDPIELEKLIKLNEIVNKDEIAKNSYNLELFKVQTVSDYDYCYHKNKLMFCIGTSAFGPYIGIGGYNDVYYLAFSDPPKNKN